MRHVFSIRRFIMAGLFLCLAISTAPLTASAGSETFSLAPVGYGIGGCFISASVSEIAGIGIIFGLCLVGLLIGLKLVINDPPEEEVIEKAK